MADDADDEIDKVALLTSLVQQLMIRQAEETIDRLALEFVLKERGAFDPEAVKEVRAEMRAELQQNVAEARGDLAALLKRIH